MLCTMTNPKLTKPFFPSSLSLPSLQCLNSSCQDCWISISLLVAAAYPHIRICYAQGKLADCRPPACNIYVSFSSSFAPTSKSSNVQLTNLLFNFFLIIRPLTVPAALEFAPQGALGGMTSFQSRVQSNPIHF